MLKKISLFVVGGLAVVAVLAQAEEKAAEAKAADGKVDFAKQIWPLIQNSCAKCHLPEHKDERGRTRRPKGELVVTNKEAFLKGGENGKVIEASKPEDSPFYTRTTLPLDHDDHMPPEDKADQWTDEQKALFKKWIEEGADFGEWTADEKHNNPPVKEEE